MESITGRRPFVTTLVRGPRRNERVALAAGLATLGGLVVLDLLISKSAAVSGTYMLAPFVSAMFGAVGATALVAVLSAAIGAASGEWNMDFGDSDYWIRLGGLLLGGVFALAGAWARERSRRTSRRLEVLDQIGAIADGSLPLADTLGRVTDLIVPVAADLCMVDVIHEGAVTRAAVRAGGAPQAAEVEVKIRTRPPSVPKWLVEDIPQWRHISRHIPHMRDEDLRRLAHDEKDLEILRGIGPRSSIAAPMIARGRSLGVLTMVSAWSKRTYGQEDVHFAQILAGRVALALDNAGIFSDLEGVERRMDAVVSMISEAVTVRDAAGKLVFANLAAARLLGFDSAQELIDAPIDEVHSRYKLHAEDGTLMTSDPVGGLLPSAELPWKALVRMRLGDAHDERWARVAAEAIRGPADELLYMVTTLDDVSEVKRAEFAQRLLASTGELLASSLDYRETVAAVARLAVPTFADWCAVTIAGDNGLLEEVAVAHVDPADVDLGGELARSYPRLLAQEGVLEEVMRSGEPLLIGSSNGDEVHGRIGDRPWRLLQELGVGSAIVAPMAAGAHVLGALTFVNDRGSRPFDSADLEIGSEIARRAGLAAANARLATDRAEVATTLQRGLLPSQLPEMDGWLAAAMYRPAGEVNEVGGDFYDAFEYEDGWMILVGDVVGRGAQAASLTALTRHTIRAAATLTGDPRAAFAMLERALRDHSASALCTAVIVVVPRTDLDPARVSVVCAGHPPPLVLREGEVVELAPGGPMLGAVDEPEWTPQEVELREGDQIVLYTDGVTEARGQVDRFGESRLREGIVGAVDPASVVTRIEEGLDHFLVGPPQDDAAAVVIQRVSPSAERARFASGLAHAQG
jgi:serine phosphatase RsbU (regulator of sigma subunit)/PAS domain-containing protein